MKTLAVLTTIFRTYSFDTQMFFSLCFTLQMSLHIYPKQSRIPLLVHGSIISSLVVHGPGSRVSISSLHQGPSRANIWDHLEPTSGIHLKPTSGKPSSHLGCPGSREDLGLTSFTWSCSRPRCDEKLMLSRLSVLSVQLTLG